MKAAVYHESGAEEVLVYEDVPDPECGSDEVRMRVRAASVNRGDLHQRAGVRGGVQTTRTPGRGVWPHVIGWDIAGEIESVGRNVDDRRVGERVVAALIQGGGYAELATAPSKDAVPIPDNVSFDEAAALPIAYLTAWYALKRRARLQPSETALIHAGASGVGVGAIQIAKNLGATVVATAGTAAKVDFCESLGADHCINYVEHDFVEEVARITGGKGVNVVLECVGGETLARSFHTLARYGRLVSVGNASLGDPGQIDVAQLFETRPRLDSVSLLSEPDLQAELADLVLEVSAGRVKAIVDRAFPLREAAEAHRYIGLRRHMGKVVLRP